MAMFTYRKIVPDIRLKDLHSTNASDTPGYLLEVFEDEVFVGIHLLRTEKMGSHKPKDYTKVLVNPREAEELIAALQEAVDRVKVNMDRNNQSSWPDRVREP